MAYVDSGKGRLSGLRLLVVDHDESDRLSLQSIAEHAGALVAACPSGPAAIAAVTQDGTPFDVAIVALRMPVMDGREVARRIRLLAADMPILGVSAQAADEDIGECLSAGMCECLIKPVVLPALIDAVARHVARRPAGRAAIPAPGGPGALVDWARLAARYAGRPALLERLLAIPGQKYADRPERLRAAARAGDIEMLRELAHATKGMASELFAEQLTGIALDTEMLARDNRQEACVRAEALADAFAAFLAELDRRAKS